MILGTLCTQHMNLHVHVRTPQVYTAHQPTCQEFSSSQLSRSQKVVQSTFFSDGAEIESTPVIAIIEFTCMSLRKDSNGVFTGVGRSSDLDAIDITSLSETIEV